MDGSILPSLRPMESTCSATRSSRLSHSSCASLSKPSGGCPPSKCSYDNNFSCKRRNDARNVNVTWVFVACNVKEGKRLAVSRRPVPCVFVKSVSSALRVV